jgi:hypothetical protein
MPSSTDPPVVTRADIDRLSREIAELRDAVDRLTRAHQIEGTRTGQLQADMDRIRKAWTAMQRTFAYPVETGRTSGARRVSVKYL